VAAHHFEVLFDQSEDYSLLGDIPVIIHPLKHFPNREHLLHDSFLLGLDCFSLAVAISHQFTVILPEKTLLRKGNKSVAEQDGDQSESKYVYERGKHIGQLPNRERARDYDIDDDEDSPNAENANQDAVHHQRLPHPPARRKLPRILVLLRKGQHQPAKEEIDVVNDQPGLLHSW
jgi:hypothetical protein